MQQGVLTVDIYHACLLLQYCEVERFLHKNHFSYRKGLVTCDALITIMHEVQHALNSGAEACLVQPTSVQYLIVLV